MGTRMSHPNAVEDARFWRKVGTVAGRVPFITEAVAAYYAMRVGTLPLLPYFAPGDAKLAAAVAAAAGKHHAVLLANHGVLVFHRNADLALLVGGVVEEAAQAAINALNGTQFGGRTLTVNEARPQEPRSGGGGGRGMGGGRH